MPSELESTFAALIGKRVSIRLHDPEGGFRDIVGYLQSPTTLRNRHEELIEISHSEIFIWKEVIAKKWLFVYMTPNLEDLEKLQAIMARPQCIAADLRFIVMHMLEIWEHSYLPT